MYRVGWTFIKHKLFLRSDTTFFCFPTPTSTYSLDHRNHTTPHLPSLSPIYTTKMTTPITSLLPEELLDRIIASTDDIPTLHSLTLTCHTLSRIATPHLYSHIALSSSTFRFLRPLAFTLWTSPSHRAAVKSFSVHRAYGGDLDPWPRHEDLDQVIRKEVEKWVVGEGKRKEWFWQVREGWDALPVASLLLRGLPGVGVMRFDGFELVDPGR